MKSCGRDVTQPVLTVVIPAHNVERYIGRCVSSVYSQRVASKIETIIIDDGSADETGQVANSLASAMDGVRVVQQANAGLGASRNIGLSQARGEYIWFVDGDDFLRPGTLEEIVPTLERTTPDILVVDFCCADEGGASISWVACPFSPDHRKSMSGAEFFLRYHETTYAWLYIFRRRLLIDNGLRFQPRINMQDAELLPRVMAVADRVLVSGIQAYVYVKRAGSFINNPASSVRERYFASVLEVRRRLTEFLQELTEPVIREGVTAKLSSINRILLMAYVYDPLDAKGLEGRLKLLQADGAFPFRPLSGAGMKIGALRAAVNFQPLAFPRIYRWLRERSLFRCGAKCIRRRSSGK